MKATFKYLIMHVNTYKNRLHTDTFFDSDSSLLSRGTMKSVFREFICKEIKQNPIRISSLIERKENKDKYTTVVTVFSYTSNFNWRTHFVCN